MRTWQKLMIGLARNDRVKRFMQKKSELPTLASRFVGGQDRTAAIQTAMRLKTGCIAASLFYLGEYVTDKAVIARTVAQNREMAIALSDTNLEVHLSVDPTQIGLLVDDELLAQNAHSIAMAIADVSQGRPGFCALMIDMEDHTVVDKTIAVYNDLVSGGYSTAITLQAYLRRSQFDLEDMILTGGKVRLVKGAFVESNNISFTKPSYISANYLKLSIMMLSNKAKDTGFYPIFATHDDRLIDKIIIEAEKRGWDRADFEFEMLYGVRSDYQKQLVARGFKVRVYLPFGEDWWPYAVRRVGENPKSAGMLIKSIF